MRRVKAVAERAELFEHLGHPLAIGAHVFELGELASAENMARRVITSSAPSAFADMRAFPTKCAPARCWSLRDDRHDAHSTPHHP